MDFKNQAWNYFWIFLSLRYRVKDKADRATMEQVMDPRTRMILFKLLNRGFISEINGCISTGKEVNDFFTSIFVKFSRFSRIFFREV